MRAQHSIPLVARAAAHAARTALIDELGALSYADLLARSERAACALLAGGADLAGARVAFLAPPGRDYVIAQWGIWRAGGIAVPLCTTHPPPELEYTIDDADASVLIAHPTFAALLAPIAARRGLRLLSTQALDVTASGELPAIGEDRGAMLLYTSGTTGKPKGVLTTHAILAAQIESVASAWQWCAGDRVLHVLP